MAIHAHPDDIEFTMAGTLLLLKKAGCSIHYLHLADGNCGSATLAPPEIAAVRRKEAENSAGFLGAVFHEPVTSDFGILYTDSLIRKTLAAVRKAAPDIILLPSPTDYMEDHATACRLAVTAAFARGVPNYQSEPALAPVEKDTVVYHTQPHGNRDQLGNVVIPDFYINIERVLEEKKTMLAFHESQKSWLEESQGMNSYIKSMTDFAAELGTMSGYCTYAEGWRHHSHLGFCAAGADPLGAVLSGFIQ
jgi:LmbE family N-acetylglucosaminyl deacetylase